MKKLSTRVFGALPSWLRPLAASGYGYYLNFWRYGRFTEEAVQQALAREKWDADRWESYRSGQLDQLLRHTAEHVPFYRDACRLMSGTAAAARRCDLRAWPIIQKETLRRFAAQFIADDVKRSSLLLESTSGTTGTPLTLWQSKSALSTWYALFEARSRRWYGVSRHDRWAILGGRLVVPVARKKPPFWVWNGASHQLYLSSYHLTAENLPRYVQALRRYEVQYVLGYPSALAFLAGELLNTPRLNLQLKVVVSNAEPLLDHQRRLIAEAFRCPVRDTYGMAEKVIGASECEAGKLHLWPEVGVLEVLQGDHAVRPGEIGDLVATSLLEQAMPLIRYQVGDRGVLARADSVCACGRTLPIIESIAGRKCDVLYGADGRPLSEIDPVPSEGVDVREAQLIQERVGQVRVLCVPGRTYDLADRRRIAAHLQAYMGEVEVEVEEVAAIERSANNKLHSVVCKVPQCCKSRDDYWPRPCIGGCDECPTLQGTCA